MKRQKWFWGLVFLAAGVLVLAAQFGAFASIGVGSIIAAVLLAVIAVVSLSDLNFFGVFVSLGILYLIFEKPLRLPGLSFWQMLLVAVLLAIGMSVIFHKPGRYGGKHVPVSGGQVDGENVRIWARFEECCKYLHAERLARADISVSFGKAGVYFDQARPAPGGAVAEVNVNCGNLELFVPKTWRVDEQVETVAGNVRHENGGAATAPDAPLLTVRGRVSFGNIVIRYL